MVIYLEKRMVPATTPKHSVASAKKNVVIPPGPKSNSYPAFRAPKPKHKPRKQGSHGPIGTQSPFEPGTLVPNFQLGSASSTGAIVVIILISTNG